MVMINGNVAALVNKPSMTNKAQINSAKAASPRENAGPKPKERICKCNLIRSKQAHQLAPAMAIDHTESHNDT